MNGPINARRGETGIERALTIPVPPCRSFAAALVAPSTDQAVDIGLHDQLQHRLGDSAKEIALVMLGHKLGQVHVRLGHRGLRVIRG